MEYYGRLAAIDIKYPDFSYKEAVIPPITLSEYTEGNQLKLPEVRSYINFFAHTSVVDGVHYLTVWLSPTKYTQSKHMLLVCQKQNKRKFSDKEVDESILKEIYGY